MEQNQEKSTGISTSEQFHELVKKVQTLKDNNPQLNYDISLWVVGVAAVVSCLPDYFILYGNNSYAKVALVCVLGVYYLWHILYKLAQKFSACVPKPIEKLSQISAYTMCDQFDSYCTKEILARAKSEQVEIPSEVNQ